MVKNEILTIEEKEPSSSLDRIQQLQVELKGNSHALKELQQL